MPSRYLQGWKEGNRYYKPTFKHDLDMKCIVVIYYITVLEIVYKIL
jgi:hypothetical protein